MDLNWLWGSIIGLGSTIIGVVLGWLLTRSRNKKITISIHYISKEPRETRYGKHIFADNHQDGELASLEFPIHLVLYNPSDKNKLVRDLRVEMHSKKNVVFSTDISNTEDVVQLGSVRFSQSVALMNIPPNSGIMLKGIYSVYGNALKNKDSFYKNFIVYNDEKNKIRRQKFSVFNYESIKFIKQIQN